MGKNTLILGCGRSGTSIFGEFFEGIKTYTYWSEPSIDSVFLYQEKKPLAVKVPRSSAKFPAHRGLSFPLKKVLDKFKNDLHIFWIVRHPLDAICSLKVGISKDWGHHPRPEDWKEWLERPLIQRCAHHWNYINTFGYNQIKDFSTLVYFEDMILAPKTFAQKVTKNTSIEQSLENITSIEAWSARVRNQNDQNFIEAKTSRAYSTNDHSVRVGRWKENLSPIEYELVVPIISKTAANFGYKII